MLFTLRSSGLVNGRHTRNGDKHNMDSLLVYDCLPCLMDAAMCKQGPEIHMIRSWQDRLSAKRLDAERWLGYIPKRLRQRWSSSEQEGLDDQVLFEVPNDSMEFQMVADVFLAQPNEPSNYGSLNDTWGRAAILKIARVENGLQESRSARPYFQAVRTCTEDQCVAFEPGVHTRWAFDGTDAIDAIINNPLSGFQPLASGSRLGSVWGSGTYFARDAKYVVNGGFCQPSSDGTRQMLMCMVTIGIPCLGDPQHKGVLPFRQSPYRYNSCVDSLSNPEIFIVQHPNAAYPAYVITFA